MVFKNDAGFSGGGARPTNVLVAVLINGVPHRASLEQIIGVPLPLQAMAQVQDRI
jgi:hypothetical protein